MNEILRTVAVLIALSAPCRLVAQGPAAPKGTGSPAAAAAPAEAKPRGRASWLADRQEFRVGDVITMVIEDRTEASGHSGKTEAAHHTTSGQLSATLDGKTVVPPVSVGTAYDHDARSSDDVARDGNLSTNLAVRVTAVTPEGNLQISGQRTVEIDGHRQDLSVSGILRPEDVDVNGLTHSSRLANASIRYNGHRSKLRGNIITRLIGALWP